MNRSPLPRGDKPLKRTPLAPGDKPLTRKTPMPSRKPQEPRGADFPAAGSLRDARPGRGPLEAAPPKVTDAERLARFLVLDRSGTRCEVCGGVGAHWSHRVARSQGGPWSATNGIRLCVSCHAALHANPVLAKDGGWHLGGWQRPDQWPAWLLAHGWVLLLPDGGVRPVPYWPRPTWLPCPGGSR